MLDHREAPVKGNTDNGLAPGREGADQPLGATREAWPRRLQAA